MSLVTWFRRTAFPETSPRLENLVRRVSDYLDSKPRVDEFTPKIIAAALEESELAVITALAILENRGIAKRHFGVYCANSGIPLESYDDPSQIEESWGCDVCGKTHEMSTWGDCKVELYFTVDRNNLTRFIAGASAA